MLCETYRNVCVLGAHQFAYSASLDDVEKYLDEGHTGMFPREDKAKAAATKDRAKGKAR
jgi:hypothetical protein